MATLIRERCFTCGYIYEDFVHSKSIYKTFKDRQMEPGRKRFPRCPSCKEPIQFISYEEIKCEKGVRRANKKSSHK